MPFFGSLGILIARGLVVAAVVVYLFSEISTFVGNALPGFFDGSVRFTLPSGIAVDSTGNVYVTDLSSRICKITREGVVTTLAGNGTIGSTDGTGTNARFWNPCGVAVDSAGNMYVADTLNNRIRMITPAGVVTTLAGSNINGFADGLGTNANFWFPGGVAVDSAGFVYVADTNNHRIRKITPGGVVSTFAGDGTSAIFNSPGGVAVDSAGFVYVADTNNHRIRKITPGGVVSTFAGDLSSGSTDGTGTNARFVLPRGVAVDSVGNVYVVGYNYSIRKITSAGLVTTLAGSTEGFADGLGTNANFRNPSGIAVDSVGNMYVSDEANQRIRKITATGLVTTLAGSGVSGITDSVQTNFLFKVPANIAFDSSGNAYVVDNNNNVIRRITPAGIVSTFAGNGTASFADGTGEAAGFNSPIGIAVDSAGIVYVGDSGNYRIRKITPGGVVTTLAGSGASNYLDETGTNANFRFPLGVVVDSSGNVYVADGLDNRIRRITPGGIVTTFAGTGSNVGIFDGAGNQATFNSPYGLAFDSSGNLYVADSNNHRIRRITPGGVVSTFAGSGASGAFGDSTIGTNARFSTPTGVAVDSSGNVYVADRANHRIRRITSAGVVTTLAGQATTGSTDGTGTSATFNGPAGVGIDSSGNINVADSNNHRIRRITPGGVVTTFAGSTAGYSNGGWLTYPVGVTTDWDGTIYVADTNNHRIRKITPAGVVTTLAGSATSGFTNGTGTDAIFNFPRGVAVNSVRTVYVADSTNRRIRAITAAGVASTFAGSGSAGFDDGTGDSATFNTPVGITVDPLDIVYVSDIGNHNIRRISSGGFVTSLAGSRTATFADGVGTNASFNTPSGIVADIYGNVYVADTNNHRIRRITSDRTVTTLAGQATPGYVDGTGTNARFNFPYHLSIDSLGILYVADQTNHRIRRIQPSTGVVTTLAGDGTAGFTFSRFSTPQGITVDRFRQAYVGDTGNHSIRKIANVYTLPENNGATNTIAGDGTAQFLDGNGIGARFNLPRGVGVDSVGNVFVGDLANNRIRRITPAGVVSLFAGSGTATFANGRGAGASFNGPWGVAADSEGNVYVGDLTNHRIRKISPLGVVSTLAGSGTATFGNGTGAGASFNGPQQVAVDREGNVYVADGNNFRIRKITPSGVVSTLAGSGTSTVTNGVGTSASFSSPQGVAVDSEGVVYVADYGGHRIRRISNVGVVTTLAGSTQGSANGIGTSATFNFPRGITVDSVGNVYVADESNHRIRKITPAGVVTTLAGTTQGFQDGIGTNARFNFPVGMSVDSVGNVYVGDRTNNRIRKIGTAVAQLPLNRGVVTTFAGGGGGFDGTGTNASFSSPNEVAVDSSSTMFVADTNNHRIRRITAAGVVSTFAGSTQGFLDGTGAGARFNEPFGVAVDSGGNVYVADLSNRRIRKITSGGVVSTLAGSATVGSTDGSGAGASFNTPIGTAVDSAGNVYVADSGSHRIRKITPAGVVSTLAGSTIGFQDGTGAGAMFSSPIGVAVDSAGFVYVADQVNNRIRRITPEGVVTTIAGQATGGSADGVGTNATFINPCRTAVDSVGNVYVVDKDNHRIRRITPQGVVSTLAGNLFSGPADGIGTNAQFNNPTGIGVDSGGIIYVADRNNNRIRKIQ